MSEAFFAELQRLNRKQLADKLLELERQHDVVLALLRSLSKLDKKRRARGEAVHAG